MNMEIAGTLIVERIDELLKKRNLKRQILADAIGISLQSFTDWKKRNTVPSAEIAVKMADFLEVDIRWLITGEDSTGISDEERDLLADWRELTAEQRQLILPMIKTAVKQAKE